VLVLSFLMVSSIRYRTFKHAGLTPPTLLAFLGVILVFVFFAVNGRISQVFLVYFSFYILLGIAEELLFGRRRRALARAHAAAHAEHGGSHHEVEEPLLPAEEDEVPLEGAPARASDDHDDDA
jgi:CDP-diacylglycerol--serine O-phosphatidyltransferase